MNFLKMLPIFLLFATGASAQFAPEKHIRMVVQGSSPSIPETSFAAKPKVIQRIGDKYARIEEEFNKETNLQLVIVTNSPDSWMVNLVDKTGKHIVDPDPKGKVKFPIFPKETMPADFPSVFEKLEFGKEPEFFNSFKSPCEPFRPAGQEWVKQYVGTANWGVALIRKSETSSPIMLFLFKDKDIVTTFKYLDYQVLAQPDFKVFEKPQGVKYSE